MISPYVLGNIRHYAGTAVPDLPYDPNVLQTATCYLVKGKDAWQTFMNRLAEKRYTEAGLELEAKITGLKATVRK